MGGEMGGGGGGGGGGDIPNISKPNLVLNLSNKKNYNSDFSFRVRHDTVFLMTLCGHRSERFAFGVYLDIISWVYISIY